MATNEYKQSTSHALARLRGGVVVIVTASLFAAVSVARAEQSALMANPAGSFSVELPAPAGSAQQGEGGPSIGPPVDPPADIAEALLPESGDSPAVTEPADPGSSTASKPLGVSVSKPIGSVKGSANDDTSGGGWGLRTALALAAVIGLILLCKLAVVKLSSRGGGSIASQLGPSGRAPSGLLSVLARYPIARGSTLVLLRLDRRVLLLSQTSQGFTTLAEIDDPEEVAALIMRAEDEEGASLTRRFRTMLAQAENDPGLIGEREYEIESDVPMTPRAATRRFHDLAIDASATGDPDPDDHADAVGSLRNRLRSLREVTA